MRNAFFHDGTGSGENVEILPSTEAPDGIGTLKAPCREISWNHRWMDIGLTLFVVDC
jgi:hypothetical protein